MEEFHKLLAKARKDKRFTQQQIADELGISLNQYQYQNYEYKKSIPPVSKVKKLNKILGIDLTKSIYTSEFGNESELSDTETPSYSPPNDELKEERAMIKALLHAVAKIESKVYNRSLTDCLEELQRNTILILNEMKEK